MRVMSCTALLVHVHRIINSGSDQSAALLLGNLPKSGSTLTDNVLNCIRSFAASTLLPLRETARQRVQRAPQLIKAFNGEIWQHKALLKRLFCINNYTHPLACLCQQLLICFVCKLCKQHQHAHNTHINKVEPSFSQPLV